MKKSERKNELFKKNAKSLSNWKKSERKEKKNCLKKLLSFYQMKSEKKSERKKWTV